MGWRQKNGKLRGESYKQDFSVLLFMENVSNLEPVYQTCTSLSTVSYYVYKTVFYAVSIFK